MLFDVHVSDVCRLSFYQLRYLSKIRKHLTQESSEIPVTVSITWRLNYCNSLFYDCREMQLKKLQYVQNTATRIITQTRKFGHLHWPPANCRIAFKILLLVFKSLTNLSPRYLADRLSDQSHSRNLQSAPKQLLEQPRSFTKT